MVRRRARDKPVTAGELLAKLEKDPEYVRRQAELERRQQQARQEYRQAAASVLANLAHIGFPVQSIGELNDSALDYEVAVPVLLRWLPRIEDVRVKEDIVRALSVKWAKATAAPALIQEYKRAQPEHSLKWAIGNALSVVADDAVFDEMVELIRDKRHGRDREMLAVALGNMRDPRAVDVLIELLDDQEVAGHAIMGLGRLKDPKARPHIERFLNHPKSWVRQEAKRALAKIDKAELRKQQREGIAMKRRNRRET